MAQLTTADMARREPSARRKTDLLISVDIEANGPIPGTDQYSMVSLGASAIAVTNGIELSRITAADGWYSELMPISDRYVQEALDVCGFTMAHLWENGRHPVAAMKDFATWVDNQVKMMSASGAVFCAWPLAFDWPFVYHYLMAYNEGRSPFGFSSALCIKTLAARFLEVPISGFGKRAVQQYKDPKAPHTHNAYDDAVEQGLLLCNLLEAGA